MATFTLAQRNCPGGQKTVSPDVLWTGTAREVMIELTSTEWAAKAGTGSLRWGIEASLDGIAPFQPYLYQPGDGDDIPFMIGSTDKSGGMPMMSFSSDPSVPNQSPPLPSGARLRLFAEPTVSIRLGAVITVTPAS